MDRVLLISGSGKGRELFGGLLREQGLELADAVSSGVEGRRMLAERDYDVILINCPLTDEYGTRLACFAAESTAAGVLLLCREEQADEIAEQVEQCGALTVPKPVNRAVMHQTLRMAGAVRRRLAGAQREKERAEEKRGERAGRESAGRGEEDRVERAREKESADGGGVKGERDAGAAHKKALPVREAAGGRDGWKSGYLSSSGKAESSGLTSRWRTVRSR